MAKNPQLEDGRTEIANELVDVLARTYFSPAESKVLWAVLRQTYGWHKKTDKISYSKLEEITGLDRRHISRSIRRLISRNIISCNNAGERVVNEYGLQKDYDLWNLSPISSTDNDENLSPESSTVDTNIVNSSGTKNGNSLLMKSVSDEGKKLTPISSTPDTTLGQSDTKTGVKSVDDIGNDNPSPPPTPNKASYKSNKQKQVRAPAREGVASRKETYLPEYVNDDTWTAYLEMRKKKRAAPTDRAVDLILKDLQKFHEQGYDVNKMLEMSIKNSWTGVFPREEARTGNPRKLPIKYTEEKDV